MIEIPSTLPDGVEITLIIVSHRHAHVEVFARIKFSVSTNVRRENNGQQWDNIVSFQPAMHAHI